MKIETKSEGTRQIATVEDADMEEVWKKLGLDVRGPAPLTFADILRLRIEGDYQCPV